MLKKGGSTWVEGEKLFDREYELEALEERVRDGTHTLLTAQRRMGKTSLVRELLRRLGTVAGRNEPVRFRSSRRLVEKPLRWELQVNH